MPRGSPLAAPTDRAARVRRRRFAVAVLGVTALAALAISRKPGPDTFVWTADIPDFGGFSGLALADGGTRLFAVSDAGYLVEAQITRDGHGRIADVTDVVARRFLQNHGQEVNAFQGDAEAIRIDLQGRLVVAFESYTRFARFTPPDMRPQPLNDWDRFADLWSNEAAEGLAVDADGGLIAVLEVPGGQEGAAAYRTLVYQGGRQWADGPGLPTDGAFQATDADFGPDGRLYVLERNLSLATGYKTRISAYAQTATGFGPPVAMLQTDRGQYGNFEGMDIWQPAGGDLTATLLSDNNFLPDAATTILEVRLAP